MLLWLAGTDRSSTQDGRSSRERTLRGRCTRFRATPDVVDKAARFVAYNNDTKTYGEVSEPRTRQISVNNGKTSAVESLIVVKKAKAEPEKCAARQYELRTVAFSGNGMSTMLLISRRYDGTYKMPDADVNAIIKSLRPLK